MHRIFQINELLSTIFQSLHDDGLDRTLATLAQVCRDFEPIALGILWRTQESLVPLVFCLPDGTLEILRVELPSSVAPPGAEGVGNGGGANQQVGQGVGAQFAAAPPVAAQPQDGDGDGNAIPINILQTTTSRQQQIVLKRALTEDDWSRVMKYSSKIHVMKLSHTTWSGYVFGEDDPNTSVPLEFKNAAHKLFPNVQYLEWDYPFNSSPEEFSINNLPMFFSPSLTQLFIENASESDDQSPLFLSELPTTCPRLTKLKLSEDWLPTPELKDDITKLFREHHTLRAVWVCEELLNAESWQAIVNHPSIDSLHISFAFPDEVNTDTLDWISESHTFSNLRTLAIEGRTLHESLNFFKNKQFPEVCALEVMYQDPPTEMGLEKFFNVIAESFSHTTLSNIHIISPRNSGLVGANVQGVTFRPLFVFRELLEARFLDQNWMLSLDDAAFDAIAQAWPKVRYLHFAQTYRSMQNGLIKATIQSLLSIAKHCPFIQSLSIPFDASSAPKSRFDRDVVPREGTQSDSLAILFARYCPIANAQDVASFLSDIFPNLRLIEYGQQTLLGPVDDEYLYEEEFSLWGSVARWTPIYGAIRAQERQWNRAHYVDAVTLEPPPRLRTISENLEALHHFTAHSSTHSII
ncbi:hypothetical protein K474DRAFT_1661062 [Panus rudis PR-1116 ss-1]|nr:hypothetical protein K474DRAFT_1661062 [Panus rudis PR-1116 ss-1]